MPGKYAPFETYLRDLSKSQREVEFTFKQIEKILKGALPASAYESELWWTKEKEANHVTPRAWSAAGWRVESVNLKEKRVSLVRLG